jgi:hypothetical protein
MISKVFDTSTYLLNVPYRASVSEALASISLIFCSSSATFFLNSSLSVFTLASSSLGREVRGVNAEDSLRINKVLNADSDSNILSIIILIVICAKYYLE